MKGGRSLREIGNALRRGDTTSVELTESALALAKSVQPDLTAFVTLDIGGALATARSRDSELANGVDRGALHGIPIAIKDVIATEGIATSACSLVPKPSGYDGTVDAVCTDQVRSAGAVVLGKTTCLEFSKGLPDRDGPFPIPRNPWDHARWTGGSSCGSASAVALGIVSVALGTDTVGSIRIPASYCGVTGFKPTFGAISVDGCLRLAPSLDHVGILGRTAQDCQDVCEILFGPTPMPEASKQLRVGVDRRLADHAAAIDATVWSAFQEALEVFVSIGAVVVDIDGDLDAELLSAIDVVSSYEGYWTFATELDRYGDKFGSSVRSRLLKGYGISPARYEAALRCVERASRRYEEIFATVDVVASPTAPGAAETVDELYGLRRDRFVFSRMWNAIGAPAISMPMRPNEASLPQGLQLAGRRASDLKLLDVATRFQSATSWHLAVA